MQEDAEAMCQVINPLIEEGNSTARSWPLDSTRMLRDVIAKPSAAQSPAGRWGSIASFVEEDAQGLGLGQALFEHTKSQAIVVGLDFIDATTQADNISGLHYHARLGFVDYSRLPNKPLADGRKVDRIQKRFGL